MSRRRARASHLRPYLRIYLIVRYVLDSFSRFQEPEILAGRVVLTSRLSFFFFLKNPASAKALSSAIKNKRAEKAARFSVPLPKVRGISEEEMFKVVATGKKTHKKGWKRVVTQPVSYTQFPPGSDVSPAKILVH